MYSAWYAHGTRTPKGAPKRVGVEQHREGPSHERASLLLDLFFRGMLRVGLIGSERTEDAEGKRKTIENLPQNTPWDCYIDS